MAVSVGVKMVVATATKEIGYLEKATNRDLYSKTGNAGSGNWTKYAAELDKLGVYNTAKNGYFWCDIFVDWCFIKTFGREMGLNILYQPQKGSGGAGCTQSASYFRSHNAFVKTPEAGDQIFFSYSHDPYDLDHTGIVVEVKNGRVYTIEGNTSSAEAVVANGGGVFKKSYPLNYSDIMGYGRPKFSLYKGNGKSTATANADALFLFSALAGLGNWSKGASRLSNKDYLQFVKDGQEPEKTKNLFYKNTGLSLINNFYVNETLTGNNQGKFRRNFWSEFDLRYQDRLDVIYAVILQNNIYKLKSKYNVPVNNLTLLILAIISVAYQTLEKVILYGCEQVPGLEDDREKSVNLYNNTIINEYLKKNTEPSKIEPSVFGNVFADIHDYVISYNTGKVSSIFGGGLRANLEDVKNKMRNSIISMVKKIKSNANNILSMWEDEVVADEMYPTGSSVSTVVGSKILLPTDDKYMSRGYSYSNGSGHGGIDLASKLGSNIYAAWDGEVELIQHWSPSDGLEDMASYGNLIILKHSGEFRTYYAHLNQINVSKIGQKVKSGQIIGKMGSTGNSTGPHLHFEIRINSTRQNNNPQWWSDDFGPGKFRYVTRS